MKNCFPDIIGTAWIPQDLFGKKVLFSNSNFPFYFLSKIPVGSPR